MQPQEILTVSDDVVCVVEPDSGSWFIAKRDRLSDVSSFACGACGASRNDEAPAGLRELWLYTNLDCNLRCRHCFLGDWRQAGGHSRPSLACLVARVDEALELGATTLFLTGGEPFLRPDLPELLAHATQSAATCVLTNATLLTDRTVAALDAQLSEATRSRLSFHVSLDGPREVHDAIRGRGFFDKAVAGIRRLREWGARPALVTALTAENCEQAVEVTRLAAEFGLGVHHLLLPHAEGRMGHSSGARPATPAQVVAAIRECRKVAEGEGVILSNDAVIAGRVREPHRHDGCMGGASMVAVGTDGRVFPCPLLVGHDDYGVSAPSLAEACDQLRSMRIALSSLYERGKCAQCGLRHICGGGCVVRAQAVQGARWTDEPFCDVYRALIQDHLVSQSIQLARSPQFRTTGVARPQEGPSADIRVRSACTCTTN